MIYTYKVQLVESSKVLDVSLDFTPYTNLVPTWNSSISGWVSTTTTAKVDELRRAQFDPMVEFTLNPTILQGTTYKDVPCLPNKNYLVSCYVRNNGVMTTGLRVKTLSSWSANYFTNRLVVKVSSGSDTSLRVNFDFHTPSSPLRNIWVGGFNIIEIPDEDMTLSNEELSLKYTYVKTSKASPSMKDVLKAKFHSSPFSYFMTMDGQKIPSYSVALSDYGVTSDTLLATYMNEIPSQIWYTFTNDVALMTMLEGDPLRVSHSYPKMDGSDFSSGIFPRVQYFEGFTLSAVRADGKPLANNITLYINTYVPSTKVLNSMQDSMISEIITQLMGELGFSAIRGSDYFREPELLYVRQTQYVKDVSIIKKVKT